MDKNFPEFGAYLFIKICIAYFKESSIIHFILSIMTQSSMNKI